MRMDNDGHDSTRLQQAITGGLGEGEGINAYFVEGGWEEKIKKAGKSAR